jgi:hypothetical protein
MAIMANEMAQTKKTKRLQQMTSCGCRKIIDYTIPKYESPGENQEIQI